MKDNKVPQVSGHLPASKPMILALAALGVVFGDIGTSPLYALRECFSGSSGMALTPVNIIGIVSVMIWTLILVVCVKYVIIVLRADNNGEGGILALMALVTKDSSGSAFIKRHYSFFLLLGILGVTLLFSDGVITPAITVLGAVEGLSEATPALKSIIIPVSLVILIALFLVQHKGTAKMGALFGPILLIWFIAIALLGINAIVKNPVIIKALNPWYAVAFFTHNGLLRSFPVMGSVFLAVTGAEVLYADLGHFGRKPIRLAWFALAFPSLILNYAGQGAFLLSQPASIANLFYLLVPAKMLYPMIILSSLAAIIASQAVISGAFSIARQAVQLGFWPRLQILHTSSSTAGQVYVPFVNWFLMSGVIALVLIFKASSNLAAAYGIAVSATMLITTMLILVVARTQWKIPLPVVAGAGILMFFVDGLFFSSNILKIQSGGWLVLCIASAIYLFMKTWLDGREILKKSVVLNALDIAVFAQEIATTIPLKIPGTAVFLGGNPQGVPRALLHNIKHNKVLHEHTIILSVQTEDVPTIPEEERVIIDSMGNGIYRLSARFGFSETPDIPRMLAAIHFPDLQFDPMKTTFFLGRELIVASPAHTMQRWRKILFMFMSHNALNATNFFKLPANRVVELGSQITL